MSSFKFNFQSRSHNDHEQVAKLEIVKKATEIAVAFKDVMLKEDTSVESLVLPTGTILKHVSSHEAEKQIQNSDNSSIHEALQQRSDLVPNVYEGGLKIWECSIDLAEFLCEENVDFAGKHVLELGCGAALPAMLAMKNGGIVHLQDYNEEVIKYITIPNAHLNCSEKILKSSRFFFGDWSSLEELLVNEGNPQKYDFILTSETIYSTESYSKLHSILKALLKPTGVIYLAAKTHYFGVGGGTRDFEDHLQKKGIFKSKVVKIITEGVQREILELKFIETHTQPFNNVTV